MSASLLWLLLFIDISRCEIFTSLVHLEKLLHVEHAVAQRLEKYIELEEARLNKLRRIAHNYVDHSFETLHNVERSLSNPVNAFLLVKRFTTDWNQIVNSLINSNTPYENFLHSIEPEVVYFPTQTDLTGSANALLRLQDTYALRTEELAMGRLQNSPKLSADDCFELGRLAYVGGDHYHTIMWMQQALELQDRTEAANTWSGSDVNVDRATLLDYLSYSLFMQGNVRHALSLTREWLEIEPDHTRAQNNKFHYEDLLAKEAAAQTDQGLVFEENMGALPALKNERPTDEYKSSAAFINYERLCRGEDTVPVTDWLMCQYRAHRPLFFLKPLKEEVVSLRPWIAVYHDVLTETEMNRIKELASPRLHRSGVFILSDTDTGVTQYRTSQSAWLNDREDPLIARVTMKTGALMNLTTFSVEDLQVLNYGIGGHYEPHYDFARPNEMNTFEQWRGNRIATVIYYLTDVEAGGATVFPELGVKLWPEKGACAVWYNLLKHGEGDYRTTHAGCPVLVGNKWVCNKWFHVTGQEFERPCGLTPEE